jgi:ABC-type branched-subunit amino acid transport system permease subunit
MLQRLNFQPLWEAVRKGAGAGFAAGLIINFLILIGVQETLPKVALFTFLLVIAIFGFRLARQLHGAGAGHILTNALALGITAALIVYLLLRMINGWQADGVNVKDKYFDKITLGTPSILSGIPETELHANPSVDLLTGEYPEDAEFRTDPMRLSVDSDHGLELFGANLYIGGFYGFLLLLVFIGVLSAALTWAGLEAEVGRYREPVMAYLSESPVAHWVILVLPLLTFAILWVSVVQLGDATKPLLSLGKSSQEVQLILVFLMVLWCLIAMRTAQPRDWGLAYPVRLGIAFVAIAVLVLVGGLRIISDNVYFLSSAHHKTGNEALSLLVLGVVAIGVAVQAAFALRSPYKFESQLAVILALGTMVITPLFLNQYQNAVLSGVGIYILLGLGLNIEIGYAGLLDLGYVAFFALGAYAYAFLSSNQLNGDQTALKFAGNDDMVIKLGGSIVFTMILATLLVMAGLYLWRRTAASEERKGMPRRTLMRVPSRPTPAYTILMLVLAIELSLFVYMMVDGTGFYNDVFSKTPPFAIGIIVGVMVAGAAGVLLSIPVLRLRGDYLAIVTLGFAEIIKLQFNNRSDYTGGPQGVLLIPTPLTEGTSGTVIAMGMVYFVLVAVAGVAFFSSRLRQSRIGRSWTAMGSDPDIAQSMGVNLVQTRLMAVATGAMFAGIGGVLYAARQRSIYPNNFTLEVSIEVLSLVIIGGMGSIPGVIMGAIVLIGIPEVLRDLATYRILVFGSLLVAMVILRPKGLLPAPTPELQDRARDLVREDEVEEAA